MRLDIKDICKPEIINFNKTKANSKVQKATQKDLEGILSIYDEFNERVYTESQYLNQLKG